MDRKNSSLEAAHACWWLHKRVMGLSSKHYRERATPHSAASFSELVISFDPDAPWQNRKLRKVSKVFLPFRTRCRRECRADRCEQIRGQFSLIRRNSSCPTWLLSLLWRARIGAPLIKYTQRISHACSLPPHQPNQASWECDQCSSTHCMGAAESLSLRSSKHTPRWCKGVDETRRC